MPRWDDAPMVGRASELATLLASVERAAAGRGSTVLLSGDAGVGKTRLLDELTARAAGSGVRVLTGHCVDLGDVGLPYLPFVDLLRPVASDPELAPASSANQELAPLFAGRPASPPTVPAAAESRDLGRPLPHRAAPPPVDDGRLQLFESVAALICELAGAGPLLLVLEDVHWADRSSRDLLRYLLARLTDEPVAVVASYRADDLHRRHPLRPLLAELVRLPGVERLELSPLPDAEVGTCWCAASPRRPDRCRSPSSRTSSPGPRATPSTPRNCSRPGCTARRCRWRWPTSCSPGWSSAHRRRSRCCAWPPSPAAGCGTSWWRR